MYRSFQSLKGRPPSAATHRLLLKRARALFCWAVSQGYCPINPFAQVTPVGRVNFGKTQLRLDEARRFVSTAFDLFQTAGDKLALGAVTALILGLRTSEIIKRCGRDVDCDGRILWVDFGKTTNARRHLEVPELLRPFLSLLARDAGPEGWLFGTGRRGNPRYRQEVLQAVERVCKAAGVPRVCTHSLRGLYATLAVQAGSVSHAVAASLGHGSFAVTARHYAQTSAIQGAQTAQVLGLLGYGGPDRLE